MEKINVAQLLKDCPQGMELDCVMFEDVFFGEITDDETYPIRVKRIDGSDIFLTKYGTYCNSPTAKCVIFPKGKTTWEGFHRPFKDGDIVATATGNWIGITEGGKEGDFIPTYCIIDSDDKFRAYFGIKGKWCFNRLATKEEKEKLFKAIKENGYEWNAKTKTLEKLIEPKFHEGDWVVFNNQPEKGSVYQVKDIHNYEYTLQHILGGSIPMPFSRADMLRLWTIEDAKDGDVLVCDINKAEIGGDVEKLPNIVSTIFIFKNVITSRDYIHNYCHLYDSRFLGLQSTMYYNSFVYNIHPATKEQRELLFQKIKKAGYRWNPETKTLDELLKFKIGDRVTNGIVTGKIRSRDINSYQLDNDVFVFFNALENWELASNKFDINTLVPFESRVLIRDYDNQIWIPTFWGGYLEDSHNCRYLTTNGCYKYCIPYEGNEHLCGTTDDCDDYFKNWEK